MSGISDEAVDIAVDAYQRAYPGGIVGVQQVQMRAALEAVVKREALEQVLTESVAAMGLIDARDMLAPEVSARGGWRARVRCHDADRPCVMRAALYGVPK